MRNRPPFFTPPASALAMAQEVFAQVYGTDNPPDVLAETAIDKDARRLLTFPTYRNDVAVVAGEAKRHMTDVWSDPDSSRYARAITLRTAMVMGRALDIAVLEAEMDARERDLLR